MSSTSSTRSVRKQSISITERWVMHKQLRLYKQHAGLYNSYKSGQQNGLRYGSDTAIATQIEAQLNDYKEVIDQLKDFTDFMWETIKSIDGIQYAIGHKIKVYELMNGENSVDDTNNQEGERKK